MIWKDIKGFENYQISNTGLIKKGDLILKPFENEGYDRILLTNGSIKSKKLIHRIVAEHFILNPLNKPQVNHKDCNKKNNNVDNLEWVTNKENVQHAIQNIPNRKKQLQDDMSKIGKMYGRQNSLNSRKPILQLTLGGNLIKQYESARQASSELNISYKCISKCCNGKLKTYKNFIWKFANEEGVSTIERINN